MNVDERIKKRFEELAKALKVSNIYNVRSAWHKWSTSVLNLLKAALGSDSEHYQGFKKACDNEDDSMLVKIQAAQGIFESAKADYERGYVSSLENTVSGEVFGDFVNLAKQSLREGHKDVAAVLACAALEDALKRYARNNGLGVEDKTMQEVVGALKSKRLVGGAQKTLLDTMPKIRDYAMHANWGKITAVDVNSVIGFVEQFLLEHFSDSNI
jgi:hypothetical protein